jgi:hypothetical protein
VPFTALSSSRPQLLRKTFKQIDKSPVEAANALVSNEKSIKIDLDSFKSSLEECKSHMNIKDVINECINLDDSNVSLKSMNEFDELDEYEKLESV